MSFQGAPGLLQLAIEHCGALLSLFKMIVFVHPGAVCTYLPVAGASSPIDKVLAQGLRDVVNLDRSPVIAILLNLLFAHQFTSFTLEACEPQSASLIPQIRHRTSSAVWS